MSENNLFSVTSLNNYIKNRLDSDPQLMGLSVRGELSNFRRQSSGHIYFTLKDQESSIKGVMFMSYARNVPYELKDGDEVVVSGSVSVYTVRGEYQIYAHAIFPIGLGSQLIAFEQLKKKLQAEGLFDLHKRPINRFPERIGIISAKGSAAMADITTNIKRRYPLAEVKQYPSLVQGLEAPKDLMRALKIAYDDNLTTLIIGRGGGSSEDLSAFNDEAFIRLAAKCPVPIISAVGHEIDFTLLDYVADLRVSTPTGAAEAATVDIIDISNDINMASIRLENALLDQINEYKKRLDLLANRSFFLNPHVIYQSMLDKINDLKSRGLLAIQTSLKLKLIEVKNYKKELAAIDPYSVLKRGYSLSETSKGKIIKSINDVEVNETITTRLKDGIIISNIIKKEK